MLAICLSGILLAILPATIGLAVDLVPRAVHAFVLRSRAVCRSFLATGTTDASQTSWDFYRQACWLDYHQRHPPARWQDPLMGAAEAAWGVSAPVGPVGEIACSLSVGLVFYVAIGAIALLFCRSTLRPDYWDDMIRQGTLGACVERTAVRSSWLLFAVSTCAAMGLGAVTAVVATIVGGGDPTPALRTVAYGVLAGSAPLLVWLVRICFKCGVGREVSRTQARCIKCGYLLAGIADSACPECGAPGIGSLFRRQAREPRMRKAVLGSAIVAVMAVTLLQSAGVRDFAARFWPQPGGVFGGLFPARHVLRLPMNTWAELHTGNSTTSNWVIHVVPLDGVSTRFIGPEWGVVCICAPVLIADPKPPHRPIPIRAEDLKSEVDVYVSGGRLDFADAFGWLGAQPFVALLDRQVDRSEWFVEFQFPGNLNVSELRVSQSPSEKNALAQALVGVSPDEFPRPTSRLDILAAPQRYIDFVRDRAHLPAPARPAVPQGPTTGGG